MKKTIISILLTMTGSAVFAEGNSTPQIPPGMEIPYNVGLSQGKICSVQHELIAKFLQLKPELFSKAMESAYLQHSFYELITKEKAESSKNVLDLIILFCTGSEAERQNVNALYNALIKQSSTIK